MTIFFSCLNFHKSNHQLVGLGITGTFIPVPDIYLQSIYIIIQCIYIATYLYKHMYPNNSFFIKKYVIQFQHREKPIKRTLKHFKQFLVQSHCQVHIFKGGKG